LAIQAWVAASARACASSARAAFWRAIGFGGFARAGFAFELGDQRGRRYLARRRRAQRFDLVVGGGEFVAEIERGQQHQARIARLADLTREFAHLLVDVLADRAHAIFAAVVARDRIVAPVDLDQNLTHARGPSQAALSRSIALSRRFST
jgi:hypothetical protein